VTAEGQEISGGEPPPAGAGRATEGDLLAERRARRAAESGETPLLRRAETAEATVQTLETHVTSLQLRLEEAEEERKRMGVLLAAEQASLAEREHELRRVKQREYAEQQLRVEAEDRRMGLDRESRAEIDRLSLRLSSSERDARELARRLEGVQRELAETEQAVVGERAAVRHAERDLKERLTALEGRALEIRRGLEAERAARERAERMLENMRQAHRRVQEIVGELRSVILRLRATAPAPDAERAAPSPAVERVIAPEAAGDTPALPVEQGGGRTGAVEIEPLADGDAARREEMAAALAAAVQRLRARAEEQPVEPPRSRPVHKHSMSLIARLRAARKQRRERR
jgi:chromosome segregation protein